MNDVMISLEWQRSRTGGDVGKKLRSVESGTTSFAVFGQQRHPRESLVTVSATVLLDVTVRLQVRAQVGAIRETPPTHVTREWLLAGVRAQVTLKQPRSREGLTTHVALAGEGVGADVHLESTERVVRLLAELAAELLLNVTLAVELFVLRQTAERRVALPACIATVTRSFRLTS